MAAPHVAGAAALLAAAQPSATVAQLRAALLGSVDAKAALSGFAVDRRAAQRGHGAHA